MKHFIRFLWLRTRDLVLARGRPPYEYADKQAYDYVGRSYSLRAALRQADVNSVAGGQPRKVIGFPGSPGVFLRVDRLGRTHLPKILRDRML